MRSSNDEEKTEYAIGKTIVLIRYFFFALKWIAIFTGIALLVLYFLEKPLWLAPVIGIALFLVFRLLRRFVFRSVLRFVRKASDEKE